MTTWNWRKQWYGYTNFGPIQFPVAPPYVILTDRNDGETLWWLINDTTTVPYADGFGLMGIKEVPPWPPGGNPTTSGIYGQTGTTPIGPYYGVVNIYPAYQEPWITRHIDTPPLYLTGARARLFVRSGQLGVDVLPVGLPDPRGENNVNQQGQNYQAQSAIYGLSPTGSVGYNVQIGEIILTGTSPGIGWSPFKVTQTPNPTPCAPGWEFLQYGTGC